MIWNEGRPDKTLTSFFETLPLEFSSFTRFSRCVIRVQGHFATGFLFEPASGQKGYWWVSAFVSPLFLGLSEPFLNFRVRLPDDPSVSVKGEPLCLNGRSGSDENNHVTQLMLYDGLGFISDSAGLEEILCLSTTVHHSIFRHRGLFLLTAALSSLLLGRTDAEVRSLLERAERWIDTSMALFGLDESSYLHEVHLKVVELRETLNSIGRDGARKLVLRHEHDAKEELRLGGVPICFP